MLRYLSLTTKAGTPRTSYFKPKVSALRILFFIAKELTKIHEEFFRENTDAKIIITPDGPTGPEHKVKPGALILSQNSNRPIVPMIVDVKNSWKFKNWHTFYLSKPFSKMRVVFGEPLYFNKNESVETGTQKIDCTVD